MFPALIKQRQQIFDIHPKALQSTRMLTRTKNLISNSNSRAGILFIPCWQIFHLPIFLYTLVDSQIVTKMTREFEEKCFVWLMDDIASPKMCIFFLSIIPFHTFPFYYYFSLTSSAFFFILFTRTDEIWNSSDVTNLKKRCIWLFSLSVSFFQCTSRYIC